MIPHNRIGRDVLVVPLTNRWHKNYMPMTPNEEVPVPTQWFNGSDVHMIEMLPNVASKEVDAVPRAVKPRVLDPMEFMKGGGLNV